MRTALLGVVVAIGCGGTSPPPPEPISNSPADECEPWVRKAKPALFELVAEAGRPMPEAELEQTLRRECADMRIARKNDPSFACVLDAVDQTAVRACFAEAFKPRARSARKTEAALQLNKLAKNAKVHYITMAAFPVGSSGLMPPSPCCGQPDNKCAVTDIWAKTPIWTELDFQIDEQHQFQYSVQSDAHTLTAQAVGDLDCDGISITYTLVVTAPDGNPTATITEPPPNSD